MTLQAIVYILNYHRYYTTTVTILREIYASINRCQLILYLLHIQPSLHLGKG